MRTLALGLFVACSLLVLVPAAQAKDFTFTTDADAYVHTFAWWDPSQGGDGDRNGNFGGDQTLKVMPNDNTWKTYLHFNLSALPANVAVFSANLKLNLVPSSYGGGSNRIYSILDETGDWNLSSLAEGAITYNNAPQNNLAIPAYGTNLAQFLNIGTSASSITRELGALPDNVDINQDVSGLLKWLNGQDAAYSTFADTDKKLTFTVANISEYFASDYLSKEATPLDATDAPRIDLTAYLYGDATKDDKVAFDDYQKLEVAFGKTTGATWEEGDFTGDGAVAFDDYQKLEVNFGTSIPEPGCAALLLLGAIGMLRRRLANP